MYTISAGNNNNIKQNLGKFTHKFQAESFKIPISRRAETFPSCRIREEDLVSGSDDHVLINRYYE